MWMLSHPLSILMRHDDSLSWWRSVATLEALEALDEAAAKGAQRRLLSNLTEPARQVTTCQSVQLSCSCARILGSLRLTNLSLNTYLQATGCHRMPKGVLCASDHHYCL